MTYKTPGVYITETDAFGSSIVGVETGVPAFVGYTEKAIDPATGQPIDRPILITSLAKYQSCFGGPAQSRFRVAEILSDKPDFTAPITAPDGTVIWTGFDLMLAACAGGPDRFCLYAQITLFFANGGAACWVMSAGSYAKPGAKITARDLLTAIDAIGQIVGPSMLVVPEACQLPSADYTAVVCAMLGQAASLRDRVAILDLPGCLDATDIAALTAAQHELWTALASQAANLSYGVAYGPALATTVFQAPDVRFAALAGHDDRTLNNILTTQAVELFTGSALAAVQSAIAAAFPISEVPTNTRALSGDGSAYLASAPAGLGARHQALDALLAGALPIYVVIGQCVADYLNVQPASGVMAGVWAQNDQTNGVWVAPANVSPAGVVEPLCAVDDTEQAGFNVPTNGMAVDILRSFPMQGTLVWGARTLDGNSDDYRYVQMRRTLIYIEQSIKTALEGFAFAANDGVTWVNVISSVAAFLTKLWEQGGLVGATPSQAFSVQCGVGSTMTALDVLNGIMIATATVALAHPAEFLELTFTQAMPIP